MRTTSAFWDENKNLFLLDTNIYVHYVRDDVLARRIEQEYRLQSGPVAPLTSIVVEAELRALAEELNWGATKRTLMEELLNRSVVLSLDKNPLANGSQMERYIEVSEFCRTRGRVLSKNDLWIAAGAMATGATLLTTDKDFTPLDPLLLDCVWINPAL